MEARPEFPSGWEEDQGDRLFSADEAPKAAPVRLPVIVGLLALALIPRAWAATLHDILCPDAVTYLSLTEKLEAGDGPAAFHREGVNIYPLILLALKHAPLDWLAAAKWWSVAMATLAVLPIYGWIRRQFNPVLAILGGVLYALHPAMVHDSPLIVRDPTFWLLFALGLYSSWRAVAEIRRRWFLVLALVFMLAIHLRSEGWFLLPVFVPWAVARLRLAGGRRRILLAGTLFAAALGPALGWLANEAVFASSKSAPEGDKRHVERLQKLLDGPEESSESSLLVATRRLAVRYVKAIGYLHGLLAIAGLLYWKPRALGASKGPLILFCLLSAGAIWVACCFVEMDRRYAYPTVIASLPAMGAGLCLAASRCSAAANRRRSVHRRDFAFWLLCLLAGSGLLLSAQIVISPRPLLYDQAAIGRWIRQRLGPGRLIAASIPETRLVGYYSGGATSFFTGPELLRGAEGGSNRSARPVPDVVLIWIDWRNPGGRKRFERAIQVAADSGYREVAVENLPEECREMIVLIRKRGCSVPER